MIVWDLRKLLLPVSVLISCLLIWVYGLDLLLYYQRPTSDAIGNNFSQQKERITFLERRLEALERSTRQFNLLTAARSKPVHVTNHTSNKTSMDFRNKDPPPVTSRYYWERRRILITGGAGFVGSHLVDKLMTDGHEVVVVDNLYTGNKRNIARWLGHPNMEFIHHDIVNPLFVEVDQIYHLASPASPPHYMANPVKTIKVNTVGTINVLGLAKRTLSRVLLASTSEVYGDPEEHPQSETYWGHVNPIGPRACYDEGKRISETLMYAYASQEKLDVRVARIFNTYGPRMHVEDGRVVSNFIWNALHDRPLKIYGNGSQTRSFQYVSDLVDGLVALMNSAYTSPVNLGNPDEHTINDLAQIVKGAVDGTQSEVLYVDAVVDDPQRRRPNITVAERELKWNPAVDLRTGLARTVEYFRELMVEKTH